MGEYCKNNVTTLEHACYLIEYFSEIMWHWKKWDRKMTTFLIKFINRLRKRQILLTIYLSYYFTYLKLYDLKNNTNFCNSQVPDEFGAEYREGSTGNFPVHPKTIRNLVLHANLPYSAKIIDVGHGSGLPLLTLYKMGFRNLSGVEHGLVPFELSERNLKEIANIYYGDAFEIDYSAYDTILFSSPFRGKLAERFINSLPTNIHTLITIAHNQELELVLIKKGYEELYSVKHPFYNTFNGKVWRLL